MKYIFIVLLIFAISVIIPDVNGTIVYGPDTNISAILWKAWLKGTGKMRNLLPPTHFNDNYYWRKPGHGAAVGRRFLKNIIAALRSAFSHDDSKAVSKGLEKDPVPKDFLSFDDIDGSFSTKQRNVESKAIPNKNIDHSDSKEFLSNDFTDYESDTAFAKDSAQLKDEVANILRSDSRAAKEEARAKAQQKARAQAHTSLIQRQHDERVIEVENFMKTNKMGTQYLYEEVKRIKRHGVIKDTLRLMVEYLEQPGMDKLKSSVLKCFVERRRVDKRQVDMWKNRITNNLAINVIKDPQSYGFVN